MWEEGGREEGGRGDGITHQPCVCMHFREPFSGEEVDVHSLALWSLLGASVGQHALVCVILLSIFSFSVKDSCPYEPMLDDIHYSMNKLRYSPCVQV